MKKKKWILSVGIVCGIIVICAAAVFAFGAILSAQGYGISTGRLYFADNSTYLIDSNDMAMRVSDCSEDKELFKGYQNGDRVVLFHNGVEESYPAQTGGHFAFRISKGDGTYKPADEVLGIGILPDSMRVPGGSPVNYDVQYIRTNGYHEEAEYPVVKIIRSVDELNAYYNANKSKYDLERHEKVYSDTTIGFLDACDKYDEAYFEKQSLIMVLLEEGSGSVRHKVESVIMGTDNMCYISIDTIVPEVGTDDDMAEWHILIEPEADVDIASASDVIVYLDGVNPKTQPTTVYESGSYSNITLTIPHDWEYETERGNSPDEYCISFWPADQTEGKIKMWYYTAFGVCGTGLEEKEITVGEYKAWQGTYDNKKVWDFISFKGMPGSYVAMNEGADKWWSEYGDEAMQILRSVKISENILTEQQVIDLAKKDVTVEYNQTSARFDTEKGLWTVSFSKKNTAGGDQVFTITHEGKIIDVEYGE